MIKKKRKIAMISLECSSIIHQFVQVVVESGKLVIDLYEVVMQICNQKAIFIIDAK
jgi:hypothetical protein